MSEYQPTYQPPDRSNTASPFSPAPSGTGPSFKTNVNRNKTKRWVNAKKYSYDGDDWGSSEEGEEEATPPPVPLLKDPVSQAKDAPATAHTPVRTEADKPLPFIRPADIYKRMADERERQREHQMTQSPITSSAPDTPVVWTPDASQHAHPLSQVPQETPPNTHEQHPHPISPNDEVTGPPTTTSSPSQITGQPEQQSEMTLHHNPSLGFRSAVHQAFDAPETPDTLNRTNSDSTISPIIRSGTMPYPHDYHLDMQNTPTIEEEPAEKKNPIAVDFKPGYRRSMSPPNPEDSPAQKPTVSANLHRVKSDIALVADPTPVTEKPDPLPSSGNIESPDARYTAPSALDDQHSAQPSLPTSPGTAPPLQTAQSPQIVPEPIAPSPSVPPKDESQPAGQVPPTVDTDTTIPSVNVEQGSPGSTYTNSVNDRLREEIMRSLTPSGSLGEEQRVDLVDGHGLPATVQAQDDRPRLKKKFSWEQESEDEEPESAPVQPIPLPRDDEPALDRGDVVPLTILPPEAIPTDSQAPLEKGSEMGQATNPDDATPPRYSTLEMQTDNVESLESSSLEATVPTTAPQDIRNSLEVKTATPGESRPTTAEMRLMGFREIVAIKDQERKMEAYRTTRDKFAEMDSGLEAWIQHMTESPDLAEVVSLNGRIPAGADLTKLPPRSKFAKLSSIGSISLPSHRETSPSGHTRHGSVNIGSLLHGQNKGKDLLHSAGVLGGKAGGAAKGLFAKGRSKFRHSSSSDKVRPRPLSSSVDEQPALAADEHDQPASRSPDHVHLRRPVSHRPLSLDPALLSLLTADGESKPETLGIDAKTVEGVGCNLQNTSDTGQTGPHVSSSRDSRDGDEMKHDVGIPLGEDGPATDHTPKSVTTRHDEEELQEITPTTPKAQLTLDGETGRTVQPCWQEPTPTTSTTQGEAPVTADVGQDNRAPRLLVPSVTRSDSSMSPVSTLGVEIDPKDRLPIGPDGKFINRAESVSTTGLSRNPTIAEPRLSFSHSLADSVPSPISQVAPATPAPSAPQPCEAKTKKSPEEASRRFSFENDGGNAGHSVAENTLGETTNIAKREPSVLSVQDQSGNAERERGTQLMSSFEQLCEFGDFSPGSIKLPSSQRPQLSPAKFADRAEKPLPHPPPQILPATQYKSLVADAITGKATIVDASPRISLSQSSVASASVNSPVSEPTSPMIDVPTETRAATVTAATRHATVPDDLTALPQPPTTDSTATWNKQTRAQSSQHATQPSQPAPMQSGSAFANLVSKIQRGHQSNAPSFSGMKNIGHRFQAFRADMQKSQKVDAQRPKSGGDTGDNQGSQQQNGTHENLPPLEPPPPRRRAGRTGSFSMLDAKKTVVQKLLKRSSQPAEKAQQDGHGKKATRRFNNFLGKPNEQPVVTGATPHSRQTQPPPRNNHTQQHELLNQLQHLRQASREEPRQHPEVLRAGRPRYYQGQGQGTGYSPRHSPSASLGSSTTPSSPVRSQNTYSPFPPSHPQRGRQGFPHHRTHTADLHLRSRSPLSHPPHLADEQTPTHNTSDPASKLGTFYSASPQVERVGDQEKPWNLTLPKGEETESDSHRGGLSTASPIVPARFALPESGAGSPVNPAAANMPPPALPKLPSTSNPSPAYTSISRDRSHSTPRTGTSTPAPPQNTEPAAMASNNSSAAAADQLRQNARHIVMEPVELPVPGDDSSEEIVMSSTAYPGQEWRPSYADGWDC